MALQKKTLSQNTYGEETAAWATDKYIWAAIEPISGREYHSEQQQKAGATHRVTFRYCTTATGSEITADHRLLFGSIAYEFTSVANFENRNIFLTCYANVRTV